MTPTLSVMARTGNGQSRPDCSTVGDILSWNVVSVMCKQMLGTMKKKIIHTIMEPVVGIAAFNNSVT